MTHLRSDGSRSTHRTADAAVADSLLVLRGVAASAIISSVTDEEVLAAVKARVQAGRPTDGGGSLPTPTPAPAEVLAEAERIIGYPLPPLLRRLYTEVANGGFGPFAGIEGLRDGYTSDGPSMLEMYLHYDEPDPDPEAPPAPPHEVLLFCDHGCAMWSLLDCRHPEGQMWWWDQGERHKCDLTLREWLRMWLEGNLTCGHGRYLIARNLPPNTGFRRGLPPHRARIGHGDQVFRRYGQARTVGPLPLTPAPLVTA